MREFSFKLISNYSRFTLFIWVITNSNFRGLFKNSEFLKFYSQYFEVYPEADLTVSAEESKSLYYFKKQKYTMS